jgi:hypothetical protein
LDYEDGQALRYAAEQVARSLGIKSPGLWGTPDSYQYRDDKLIIMDAQDWLNIGFKPSPDFPGYIEVMTIGGLCAKFNAAYPLIAWCPALRAALERALLINRLRVGGNIWTIYEN